MRFLPIFALLGSCLVHSVSPRRDGNTFYMNQFAVHIPDGAEHADNIASKHGFSNLGQIGNLKGYYLFEHQHVHKRSLSTADEHHEKLSNEPQVLWVQQQHEKKRPKRDFYSGSAEDFARLYQEFPQNYFKPRENSRVAKNGVYFTDPLYKEEWYLNGGARGGFDMNVKAAWQKGYSGKGVVVSILDDGIQINHPDLAQNYDPHASYDINDNDPIPMPRDNGDNKHGTRCAGEVASVAHNNYCGVGVAFNSSIGGVRMLDGSVNDAVEAKALSLNPNHIDIYSASWGPEDDGKTVDGPGPLARRAFINGVTTGRNGKGSIFIWASGNGGRHTDNCNCDGYTNSIFTLSISSATQGGYKPWYLEECSSTLAATYSSGTPGHDKSIATVDMDGTLRSDHLCTVEHTGTSASAPLAAGLCALALEANPSLTWRDMQHIVIMTANPKPLTNENGWTLNGMKRKVSHKFGFGLMDGAAMVSLAENWITVPPQHICKTQEIISEREISPLFGSLLKSDINANGCPGTVNEVRYLEHVQCKVTLRFFPRGNLRIILTSPSGTSSTLLMERPRDVDNSNFDEWPFLSVHFWGENPYGKWTLQIANTGNRKVNRAGFLKKWQLVFYGTAQPPYNGFPGEKADPPYSPIPSAHPAFVSEIFSSFPSFQTLPNIFSVAGSEKTMSKVPLSGTSDSNELESSGCHESCATCAGTTQDSCLTCSPDLLYVTDLGLCLQRCPDGYYEDTAGNQCISCQGNCASCPDGPNICSSCDHHLILHNSTCVASCPKYTYETDDYRCNPCHSSCGTCKQGGASGCVTCLDDSPASVNGHCPLPGTRCSTPHCVTCLSGVCSECAAGYLLNNAHHCYPDPKAGCKPGEYKTEKGCKPCVDFTNCTRCPPELNILNNTCVVSCGLGYFTDSGWCQKCAKNCAECQGDQADQCLSCDSGYKVTPTGTCVQDCPSDTYTTNWGCIKCHHFCSSCSGEGPYACTSCIPGRYLDAASKLCMPCTPCNSTHKHQCCHCDPVTGKCHLPAGKRRITSEQAERAHQDELIAEASMTDFTRENPSQFTNVTLIAVASCASVVVLFGVIFAILQVIEDDNKYSKEDCKVENKFDITGVKLGFLIINLYDFIDTI
ncbi:furin-like protease 2 isoform X2 [Cimex lectularius]|uniref:furin n=1 Tax=Cimex lectularius TaxID=79782 RepID=A0A8I6SN29_CIMLE|nr:furin-like protease 2 isoform X2 [Cimex lectularius]